MRGSWPESMKARRTAAAGISAAAAIASSITPSNAPWRSSPVSSRRRNACSSAVAAPNSPLSRAARRAVDPAPEVCASSSRAASTAATGSDGSGAGSVSSPARVRQPVPIRPWRGSPASHAVAGSTSSGPAARSSAASDADFSVRDRVAPTAAEVATTSASSTRASSQRPPTLPRPQPERPGDAAQRRPPRAMASTSSASSSCSAVSFPLCTCPRSSTTSRIVLRSCSDCLAIEAASS